MNSSNDNKNNNNNNDADFHLPNIPNIDLSDIIIDTNHEINIDCENYDNNDDHIVNVNNGSSNILNNNNTVSENNSRVGIQISPSTHTLFELSSDNSFRVVRSYRQYAAEFINSDDSDLEGSGSGSGSDDTSVNDTDFIQPKKMNSISNNNSFINNNYNNNSHVDIYRDQSRSTLRNIAYINDDIEKSKTVKSSSTSSSKATYKNPTLSSVVNQTYSKSYSSLEKLYLDPHAEDLKSISSSRKTDPQLKLQKMILNVPERYDIPTRNKKIVSQRILNVTLVIMLIIASLLLSLYIYLKFNHGYSYRNLKDINDSNRAKIVFISFFMFLAVALGILGSALNWKSILLTYSIFCTLNAFAMGYLVYGIYDDAYRFTSLPHSWWDDYTPETRRTIQDEFSCCGYKDPLDGGEISNYCAKEAVVWNIPYEVIYDNFSIMTKDNSVNNLNVTVVLKKNKNKNGTVQQPVPTIIPENTTSTPVNSNENTNSTPSPSPSPSPSNNNDNDNYSKTNSDETSTISTPTPTPTESSSYSNKKRSFEIVRNDDDDDDDELEIVNYSKDSIYRILDRNEVEEENDSREDKEISNIRVLNRRNFEQETKDAYQLRTNSSNPEINQDKIKNSNYTSLTPEESKAYSKANGLEGCEMKLQHLIHKNLTPLFYILLLFFCLYIITIPVALIFLFKLRKIKTVSEFE